MHPAALNISFKTLAEIIIRIIINSYRPTRIIILPMVVTIFASQVCSLICLKIDNVKAITRGRTFTSAMSVRCYKVIQVAPHSTSA